MKAHCDWHEDEDGNWETSCHGVFLLSDGTPSQNKMAFCCYCGKKLVEHLFYYEDESDSSAAEGDSYE
jgi:hypothetical protein